MRNELAIAIIALFAGFAPAQTPPETIRAEYPTAFDGNAAILDQLMPRIEKKVSERITAELTEAASHLAKADANTVAAVGDSKGSVVAIALAGGIMAFVKNIIGPIIASAISAMILGILIKLFWAKIGYALATLAGVVLIVVIIAWPTGWLAGRSGSKGK